ncbi:MAG TPA: DUF3857 domain-containing protein, partial [Pyrinomonadaceae bacterium]|nr:DUF3857 domain-containing protein [Pyrinomonadaceae bacterium]
MRSLSFFVLLLSLLLSPGFGQSTRDKGRSAKPVPKELLSLGATVEKYVSNYEINADGTAHETVEMQRRCSSNECIEFLSTFKQIFNSDLQQLKVLDAYLVKADGKIVKLPATAITDRPTPQSEAAPGFSSLREVEIKYSPWRVGDAGYVKIESVTTKPILEKRFDALELFPVIFDWKSIEVNVSAPAGYELFAEAVGLDGGKLADENGRSRWRYTKQNVSRIDIEPVGSPIPISPRFALTTFRNPGELGAAFWEILEKKTVVTPEIQTLADQITKDATTPSQQASAIYEWVNKNIRYFLIVLDSGGWVPHDASQIVKNGYGDCKDYTVLIHTLLKAKGIESTPVLIRSEVGNWFPAVPAMQYFNHAVLYIPSLNLFADATIPNTRLGLIPQTIVGKKAVLAGPKSGTIDVPRDNPADNQITSDVTYTFSDNGNVKAQTKNTYLGRSEIVFRPLFGETNSNLLVKMILAYFGINGDGKVTKIGNPHQVGEAFSVEMEAGVEDYTTFTPRGKLALPVGLNLINFAAMEPFVSADSRKTSAEVGATRIRENITIQVPASVTVAGPPASVSFSTSIGSFNVNPELKDGKLRIIRELVIKKDSIDPSDYPQFKELIGKLVASNNVEIDYTADPSLLVANTKERKKAKADERSPEQRLFEAIMGGGAGKELTSTEVRQLETRVAADESDEESRIKLLRHYANPETKKTPANNSAFLRHRLWLIKNRPRMTDNDIFGLWFPSFVDDGLPELRTAWLDAVAAAKSDSKVRLNAIDFLMFNFPDDAEKMVAEGITIFPTEYKYPLLMSNIALRTVKKDWT